MAALAPGAALHAVQTRLSDTAELTLTINTTFLVEFMCRARASRRRTFTLRRSVASAADLVRSPPPPPPAGAMDAKVVAVLALVLAALCLSDGECPRQRARLLALCGAAAALSAREPLRADPVSATLVWFGARGASLSGRRGDSRTRSSRRGGGRGSELRVSSERGLDGTGVWKRDWSRQLVPSRAHSVSRDQRAERQRFAWCWRRKPVSLSYRCPCRFFESHVARSNVKHLKILNTPNCALQIVARLKNNNRQVCIDPKLKWIQEYLDKALNKGRHWAFVSQHNGLTSIKGAIDMKIEMAKGTASEEYEVSLTLWTVEYVKKHLEEQEVAQCMLEECSAGGYIIGGSAEGGAGPCSISAREPSLLGLFVQCSVCRAGSSPRQDVPGKSNAPAPATFILTPSLYPVVSPPSPPTEGYIEVTKGAEHNPCKTSLRNREEDRERMVQAALALLVGKEAHGSYRALGISLHPREIKQVPSAVGSKGV
ncbi:Stromal cell-derived factor 1 [Galemys pyrenaicus]|uniref:Stromal cell-derived factor 1 n=1 Tax=Galemys pyrenaicus TaxID=202257 RepID=A0A8J6ASN4_GALPY|nr:Stromal cell-derived factor 1 [Galemys pyrenaicus]